MRAFMSGTEQQGHWLCYDEPGIHFVEVTTTDRKQHFFELPFPGMVIYAPGMAGKLSSTWPWIALTNQFPLTKAGNLSKKVKFSIVPLGHVYDYGNVCIYNKVPRPTIHAVLSEFWQSRSTYFVEGQIGAYVHKHYPNTLSGSPSSWSYFIKTDFFDAWEKDWTVDNISEAPFINLPISTHGRAPVLDKLAPWKEIDITEQISVVAKPQAKASAA